MFSHLFLSRRSSLRFPKRRSFPRRPRTGTLRLESLESLESRIVPTSIAFQIPASIANDGVQVGIYYGSQYLSADGQYKTATASSTVPLIQLTNANTSNDYTGTQWER
jgi:hypothetical protein